MGKACCAIRCRIVSVNVWEFIVIDPSRKSVAVGHKNCVPNEYSWLCSVHFISGGKSNDPLSLDYVTSLFEHILSPLKRKHVKDLNRFHRTSEVKKTLNMYH